MTEGQHHHQHTNYKLEHDYRKTPTCKGTTNPYFSPVLAQVACVYPAPACVNPGPGVLLLCSTFTDEVKIHRTLTDEDKIHSTFTDEVKIK